MSMRPTISDPAGAAHWLRGVGIPVARALQIAAYPIVPGGTLEPAEAAVVASDLAPLADVLADGLESLTCPDIDSTGDVLMDVNIFGAILRIVAADYGTDDRARVERASWVACLLDGLAGAFLQNITALADAADGWVQEKQPESVITPNSVEFVRTSLGSSLPRPKGQWVDAANGAI